MAGGTTEQRKPVDHVERLPMYFAIAVLTLVVLGLLAVAAFLVAFLLVPGFPTSIGLD